MHCSIQESKIRMKKFSGKLAEQVRKYPYLYDPRDDNYKNTFKKAETWNEIAYQLKITSNVARVKWKNLRDSYRKHKYGNIGTLGTDGQRKQTSAVWNGCEMSFLDYTLRDPRQANNDTIANSIKFEFAPVENTESDDNNTESDDMSNQRHLSLAFPKRSRLSAPPSSKRIAASYDNVSSTFYSEINDSGSTASSSDWPMHELGIKSTSQPDNYLQLDAMDHLFLSYAKTFKTFQPTAQVMVKLKLAKLFANAEFKEIAVKEGKSEDQNAFTADEC